MPLFDGPTPMGQTPATGMDRRRHAPWLLATCAAPFALLALPWPLAASGEPVEAAAAPTPQAA